MANTKTALKRWRQSIKRRERNRAARTLARTRVRRVRDAAKRGDQDTANELLNDAYSALDRAAKKGAIHHRNADRRKRRLAALLKRTSD